MNELSMEEETHFPPSLLNAASSDITIKAKDHKKFWRAHKVILSNASGFFRGLFDGKFPEKHALEVDLDIDEPKCFETMLRFIYHENIDVSVDENPYKLFLMADKYLVRNLRDLVIDRFRNTVSAYPDLRFARLCDQVFSDKTHKEINGSIRSALLQNIKKRDVLGLLHKCSLSYSDTEHPELPIAILTTLLEGVMDAQNLRRVSCTDPGCEFSEDVIDNHWCLTSEEDDVDQLHCIHCGAHGTLEEASKAMGY